jgi:hypothetical protein
MQNGFIDFDEGPHGEATDNGIPFDFELDKNGVMDFGREYTGNDRFWRTDINQVRIRLGAVVVLTCDYGPFNYEIMSIV